MGAVAENQSELVTFQYSVWGAALAFVLAGAGFIFVSYGVAIGLIAGAIFLFACAQNFHNLARLKLAWPLAVAEQPLRGHWEVFRFATITALLLTAIVSSISSTAIYIFELRRDLATSEARQQVRHLREDQKERIRRGMALNPNEKYDLLQVNSLPSCDECERFGDEIRIFINTIPGWTAGGGPLMWAAPQELHNGLWLMATDEDRKMIPVKKINNAFSDGGLPLQQRSDGVYPGLVVLFVGRPD
jgi:hypothetical protein